MDADGSGTNIATKFLKAEVSADSCCSGSSLSARSQQQLRSSSFRGRQKKSSDSGSGRSPVPHLLRLLPQKQTHAGSDLQKSEKRPRASDKNDRELAMQLIKNRWLDHDKDEDDFDDDDEDTPDDPPEFEYPDIQASSSTEMRHLIKGLWTASESILVPR